MSFSKPSLIRTVLTRIEENDLTRSKHRSWVDRLFNGEPPWTPAEAQEEGIEWNYSNKQGAKLAHDARGRFNNAHLSSSVYFSLKLDSGPRHKRPQWQARATNEIGRMMKRSLPYETTLRETFAPTVLHGAGPCLWPDKFKWNPECVGLGDLRIPSRTYVNFRNHTEMGIYREFTPGELARKIGGEKVSANWKKGLVKKAINWAVQQTDNGASYTADIDIQRNPERWWEELRANSGYWCSDAVQTIPAYDFYHQDHDDQKWYRKIILTNSSVVDGADEGFLYNSTRPYADNLSEFFHCQFADYNNVAPFYFGSVRGLGHMLYDLIFALNRLDCKITESAFEQLMMLFFASDPADRDRLDKLILQNRGVIPDGLRIVPNTERYSPNQNIVQGAAGRLQNQVNQNSSSFTNDAAVEAGQQKEQTLGEWAGKLSIYNQMVSATLELSYRYQTHQYREIFRRFCKKDSTDKDVQEYQKRCLKAGIPKEILLDAERWEVVPERVMGGGNRALAVQEAQAIYNIRPSLSPRGQVAAAHNLVMAISNNPDMADELVDLDAMPKANTTQKGTEALFGTIMQGIMPMDTDIADHISVIETMLGMLGAKVNTYQQTGGIAPAEQIIGMQTAAAFTDKHIKLLAEDPEEKAKVKEYGDALKEMQNLIKAFGQRALQALEAQAKNGENGEANGQQAEIIKAQTKAKITDENAAQKRAHKEQDFAAKQSREDKKLAADLAATSARAETDIAITQAKGISDIRGQKAKQAVETSEELG